MMRKQKMSGVSLSVILLIFAVAFSAVALISLSPLLTSAASAQSMTIDDRGGSPTAQKKNNNKENNKDENSIDQTTDPALEDCTQQDAGRGSCNLYTKYINPIITFLTAAVGLAVTIGLISGGIRYAMAGSEPGKVAAAQKQIKNALIALVTFLFLAALLNWLVPGGVI